MDWIIPCNVKKYDVIGAFSKLNCINWKQSTNIRPGDLVYIYLGIPHQCIKYKTVAISVDLPVVTIDDSEFIIEDTMYKNYGRYMELLRLETYHDNLLEYKKLVENGLNSIQGPCKVPEKLANYINMFDRYKFHNLPTGSEDFQRFANIHNEFLSDFNNFNENKSRANKPNKSKKSKKSNKTSSYYNYLIRLMVGFDDEYNFKDRNLYEQENLIILKKIVNNQEFSKFNKKIGHFYSATIRAYEQFISYLNTENNIVTKETNLFLEKVNDNENNNFDISYKPDYMVLNQLKQTIGLKGEQQVLEFEIKRLEKEKINFKPIHVSLNDDSKGYDILSKTRSGNKIVDRYIEVKSTNSSFNKTMDFYLSANELKFAKNNNQYYLYLVSNISESKPEIEIMYNPF